MKTVYNILFILAVVAIAYLDACPPEPSNYEKELLQRAQRASENIPAALMLNTNQKGTATSLYTGTKITEEFIHKNIKNHNRMPQSSRALEMWNEKVRDSNAFRNDTNPIIMSARGIDWKHHFANSYLVGVRPFEAENNWLPLYTISSRKTYQLDSKQYNTEEMWQNSAQAYVALRGDCEDHAILLADWLISEGVDARVAVGRYKDGGHAWVVAIQEGKEYLLEATDKRKHKSWNHYPLASLASDYHPKYMFNRTHFWVNKGSEYTTSYSGAQWEKSAEFTKG